VRLVLDTNTVVSGLIWSGNPGKLLDAARAGQISIATTVPLLAELRGVLARGKFARELGARALMVDDLFNGYVAIADCLVPAPMTPTVIRDPADDQVLACALAAKADLIVSGDMHLLSLGSFREIPIVGSSEALARIASASGRA
jgi:putative PIN family toxin of toxin-antitoxin system